MLRETEISAIKRALGTFMEEEDVAVLSSPFMRGRLGGHGHGEETAVHAWLGKGH